MGSQLDYILISARRKSCIQQCKPLWGPSIHRDRHGFKNDHALVKCTWKWRLRFKKTKPVKDVSCLYEKKYNSSGNLVENPKLRKFNEAVSDKLLELQYSKQADTTAQMYNKLCKATAFAVSTVLPNRIKVLGSARKVTSTTKALFKKRRDMRGNKEQYEQLQQEIVRSSLADYQAWVSGLADEMQTANAYGNTREVHRIVKKNAAAPELPPTNLSKDKDGKLLSSANYVAQEWMKFLENKFAATPAESKRPDIHARATKYQGRTR